jgi:hypothetical protein
MNLIIAGPLALLLLLTPASAQSSATSHDAAALEFLNVIGMEKILKEISTALANNLVRTNPPLAPHRELIIQWSDTYITWKAAAPELVKTYKQTFTEPELRELTAFYRTATGQKMASELPGLMESAAAAGGRLAGAHITELERMLRERGPQPQGGGTAPAKP